MGTSRLPRAPGQKDNATTRALGILAGGTIGKNQFLASPSTQSGALQLRAIAGTDLPAIPSTLIAKFLQSGVKSITGSGTVTTTFPTGIVSATCTIKASTMADPCLVSCTFTGNTLTIYTWQLSGGAFIASVTAANIDWIATGN